jgi:hypothetical protein
MPEWFVGNDHPPDPRAVPRQERHASGERDNVDDPAADAADLEDDDAGAD